MGWPLGSWERLEPLGVGDCRRFSWGGLTLVWRKRKLLGIAPGLFCPGALLAFSE